MLMNFKKPLRRPIKVAVHLQRAEDFFANSSPAVQLLGAGSQCASEMRTPSERKAFIAGPSLVRRVLSIALGCAPEEVAIFRQANGKPGILGQGIQFNVSHCGDWCAVAWSAEGPVGVGVEVIRPVRNMEDIVSNFFPPIAQRAFHSASSRYRTRVFFHWWTQIEAALKASGGSLDDSYTCLDEVVHGICDVVPGVALAVAVVGAGPLTITWHLP